MSQTSACLPVGEKNYLFSRTVAGSCLNVLRVCVCSLVSPTKVCYLPPSLPTSPVSFLPVDMRQRPQAIAVW